jgi:protein TonB
MLSLMTLMAAAPTEGAWPPPPIPIAPAALESKAQPARPANDPGEWVTREDYPTSALRDEAAGLVGFRLTIDAAGKPTACLVTVSSGTNALDQATCDLVLVRAQFTPATDFSGRAAQGSYSSRVRWVIPEPEPEPPMRPMAMQLTWIAEPDGKVTDCRVIQNKGLPAYFDDLGELCKGSHRPRASIADESGQAYKTRKRVTTTLNVEITDP